MSRLMLQVERSFFPALTLHKTTKKSTEDTLLTLLKIPEKLREIKGRPLGTSKPSPT